jgi:hypothetical protein
MNNDLRMSSDTSAAADQHPMSGMPIPPLRWPLSHYVAGSTSPSVFLVTYELILKPKHLSFEMQQRDEDIVSKLVTVKATRWQLDEHLRSQRRRRQGWEISRYLLVMHRLFICAFGLLFLTPRRGDALPIGIRQRDPDIRAQKCLIAGGKITLFTATAFT